MSSADIVVRSTQPHPRPFSRKIAAPAAWAWSRRHDPQFRFELTLLAFFIGSVAAFAHIAEDYVTRDPLVRWDLHFSAWLHEHSTSGLVSLFKVVTWAGNVVVLAMLTVLVAVWLLRRRAILDAVLLCTVAAGIELLNGALKLAFHRPRPELAYVHLDTYSFPSGHAAGSAAVYGVLAFLVARHYGWLVRAGCAIAYVVLVGLVGFSRLYLQVHYLSDVLSGFCVGLAWLTACLLVREAFRRRSRPAPR